MSSDVIIKVSNLSKCYHIYEKPHHRLLQMMWRGRKKFYNEFWAVNDVSLEIKRGETIGIIGRNGSGKSTLLQLICGTLNPTSGDIEVKGRIAALLELGAGFNPEFTGRENVYMNGAVLGLSKDEIDNRYESIAAFADIGDFIEQPVKTYSSGMYVRLAFAVAIHVDPEVLVVDEALSVGDAYFQAKCARAIRSIMERGATVLFVSHDTAAVKSLCDRAVLLEKGRVRYLGDVNTAVEQYYSSLIASQQTIVDSVAPNLACENEMSGDDIGDTTVFDQVASFQRIQQGQAEFLNVLILNDSGEPITEVEFGQKVTLRQVIEVKSAVPKIGLAYHIRDKNGLDVIYSDTGIEQGQHIVAPQAGEVYFIDWNFKACLREGEYVVSAMASEPLNLSTGVVNVIDFVPIACRLRVIRGRSLPIYGAVWWENKLTMTQVRGSCGG